MIIIETDVAISFGAYADMLKEKCPALFTGDYRVFTEFGRRINAKPGFIVSRVEYNKDAGNMIIYIAPYGVGVILIW